MGLRIRQVQEELKERMEEDVKRMRVCLEEGMFAKEPVVRNATMRENGLRQR